MARTVRTPGSVMSTTVAAGFITGGMLTDLLVIQPAGNWSVSGFAFGYRARVARSPLTRSAETTSPFFPVSPTYAVTLPLMVVAFHSILSSAAPYSFWNEMVAAAAARIGVSVQTSAARGHQRR